MLFLLVSVMVNQFTPASNRPFVNDRISFRTKLNILLKLSNMVATHTYTYLHILLLSCAPVDSVHLRRHTSTRQNEYFEIALSNTFIASYVFGVCALSKYKYNKQNTFGALNQKSVIEYTYILITIAFASSIATQKPNR